MSLDSNRNNYQLFYNQNNQARAIQIPTNDDNYSLYFGIETKYYGN